jgi:membrane-bound lytic murein transglycosylase D
MRPRFARRDALSALILAGMGGLGLLLHSAEGEAAPASADQHVQVGPGRGSGERELTGKAPSADKVRRPSTNVGPNDPEANVDDPDLRALSEAERELFPRSLADRTADLTLDLPGCTPRPGPLLSVSGLPLAATRGTARERTPNRAWPRGLSLPDLPVAFEQRTLDYIKFFRDSERGRSIAESWARKAGRYGPAIQAELARAGLPVDLVWMSLVESGHNVTIRSRAGAAGLWQFIPQSARLYGLTVNRWVDERLDPMRSTQAAAEYLKDLERRFGSWELAMAAYNMGNAGLTRAIRKYNTNDFWRLARLEAALPWETALYVPKIVATAVLMKNKRAFGLSDAEPDPPASFDTVYVPAGVSLASIAQDAGVPAESITSLNPHYLAARTPPAAASEQPRLWPVYVPRGQGAQITRRLAQRKSNGGGEEYATYRVRLGDTSANIAQRFQGAELDLRVLNRLDPNERLAQGCTLLLPRSWVQAADGHAIRPLEDTEDVVVVPSLTFQYPERERVFYRTLPGDDLESIAAAFRLRPEDLVAWNGLDPFALLQPDMMLSVFLPKNSQIEDVRYIRERNVVQKLEVGSQSFFAHFEAEQGRQRLQIVAHAGETLQGIGRRYGLSAGTMERINHFARDRRLTEGAAVVVYAKSRTPGSEVAWSLLPDPLPPVAAPYPGVLPRVPGT